MFRHRSRTSLLLAILGSLLATPGRPAELGGFTEFSAVAADAADAIALGGDAAYFRSPRGAGLVAQVRAVDGRTWVLSGEPSHPSDSLVVTDLEAGEALACASGEQRLCLDEGRLQVEVESDDGRMYGASLADPNGTFWLDDPARPEVIVSVVDGRQVSGNYWILYGSPTGAAALLRITDPAARRSFEVQIAAGDTTTQVLALELLGPRVVTPTLDRARSVSATVPVAGKTLTARSANGSVFTLIIPAGALLSDETITLTPVASVGGLPFHPGLVAAVHLEPEGLRLFQAATLRIKPPVAVPRAQEMTFAYRGTGQEFFLYPPTANAAGVELKLLHFSGYGVAKGSLAEQTAQLLRLPSRAEDRLSQKLQAIVSKKRRGGKAQAGVVSEDYVADLRLAIGDFYKVSVKPKLNAVKTSCATLKKQAPIMLGWSRWVQLLGLTEFDDEVTGVFDALELGTANCYNEAFGKCVNQHDPTQVTEMFSALRQLALLGADDLVDPSRIEKCVRFDLDFETDVEYHTTVPNASGVLAGFDMKLRAKVPLRYDGFRVSGSAPLEWLSATWTGVLPAGVTIGHVGPGGGSTLAVANLAFDLNVFEGAPRPPQIQLVYDPGSPVVLNSFTFDDDPPVTIPFPDFEFRSPYYFLHQDEATSGLAGPLVARDWSLVGGSVWARKTYQRSRSVPEVTANETTLMDLIHTPAP